MKFNRESIRTRLIFPYWATLAMLTIIVILSMLIGMIAWPDWITLITIFGALIFGLIFVRE
jgi:hypothetical protein